MRGTKSKSIRARADASTVRPCAGKPASKRTSRPRLPTTQALRSSTSGPGLLVPKKPLLPEPPTLWLQRAAARQKRLTRKSSKATLRHGVSNSAIGQPACS